MERGALLMVRNKSQDAIGFVVLIIFFVSRQFFFFQGKDEATSKTPKTFCCSVRDINKVTDALLI